MTVGSLCTSAVATAAEARYRVADVVSFSRLAIGSRFMDMVEKQILTADGLSVLLGILKDRGYRVVGPTVQDQAIVYDDIDSPADLPQGWTDEQDGGHYRLAKREDEALFGYAVGPQSWKRFLHPPTQRLWRARRDGDDVEVIPEPGPESRFAFIGVRSCELHAMAIQDRVLLEGPYGDSHFAARRANNFIVAVNCSEAGGTCFCVSMDTGPKATAGFDLAMTEITGAGTHRFVIEAGTEHGQEVLGELSLAPADSDDVAAAEAVVAYTTQSMGRAMDTAGIRDLLMDNLEHPRWDDVAARCLTCANCTMVCPTCFCTSVADSSDLTGTETERTRRWDSCFTMDFSYIHGGSVRPSTRSRYRQWMTHKLATWHDQFGTSGCVGCGRCITWCPVGIDITEEVGAIQNSKQDQEA
jgi:ferredoxin